MTADNPRTRTPFRTASAAGLILLLALAGCKSKDGGGGLGLGIFNRGDSGGKPRDPLVYGPNRIPPQNVPVNDRGGVGAKGKADPLIGSPTAKSGDKTGVGYSDDPERFKGTFVPSEKSTPAALAARPKGGDELKIDDRDRDRDRDGRVPLQPAGGTMPADAGVGRADAGRGDAGRVEAGGLDGLYAELKNLGVQPEDRSLGREDGRCVFRASVPIGGSGAKRQYTAYGDTEAEAVKKVIEYVMADRK